MVYLTSAEIEYGLFSDLFNAANDLDRDYCSATYWTKDKTEYRGTIFHEYWHLMSNELNLKGQYLVEHIRQKNIERRLRQRTLV